MSAYVQFEYEDNSHIIGDSSEELTFDRAKALYSLLCESPRLRYAAVFSQNRNNGWQMRQVYFRGDLYACFGRERERAKDDGAVVRGAS